MGSPTTTAEDIFQVAVQSGQSNYEDIADIQERILERQNNQNERHQ